MTACLSPLAPFIRIGRSARLGLLLALLMAAVPSRAADQGALERASSHYRQANTAYEKSDYEQASKSYRQALDEGAADPRLYYNYANSLFRLRQLGLAILYYEKALKLAPNDPDIAFNLRFANAQTVDKNPVPEANILTKVLWALHSSYSINQGLWLVLGLFAGLFAMATLALYAASALRGFFIALAALGLLALAVLAPSLIYKIKQQETVRHGIVLVPALEMYSGPGDNYQVLTKVHEGTKFEIVEVHGDWASVKLLNGKGGYVRLADLGKV